MTRFPRLAGCSLVALVLASGSLIGYQRSSAQTPSSSAEPPTSSEPPVLPPGDDAVVESLDDEWQPGDAYQAISAKMVDGVLPVEAALQLFALQYGPIPGVEVAPGAPGPARTGTLSMLAVFGVWSELSADQQAAVRGALGLAADFDPGELEPGGAQGGFGRGRTAARRTRAARHLTDGPGTESYRRSLDAVRRGIESHLGPLPVPVVIEAATTATDSAPLADSIIPPGLAEDSFCRIRVFPQVFPAPTGASITMAHEFVHCFHWLWAGSGGVPWVTEGTAEWAAMTALSEGGFPVADEDLTLEFREYYLTPGRPLFDRSYDAVGWWAHLREQGGDVWGTMYDVATAGSSTDAYDRATVGAGDGLVAEWGTANLDGAELGPRWVISGPGVPVIHRVLNAPSRLANGAYVELTSPAYASAYAGRHLDGDLLRVTISAGTAGYLWIENNDHALAELTGTTWCTSRLGNCVCPPGTRRAGESFTRLGTGLAVAGLSAGTAAGRVTLAAVSLEDECERQANCLVGTWVQDGPPANELFITIAGGGGATVTFAEDGRVTFDFSTMEPWKASPRSDPTGVITARLDGTGFGAAVYPEPPSSTARVTVTDVDMSSVSGTASMEVNGVEIGTIDGSLVRELWGAVEGADWTVASCEGDTMTMGSGVIVATYHRNA